MIQLEDVVLAHELYAGLTFYEREVVSRHIIGGDTLDSIGAEFDLSGTRIAHIEKAALDKMRTFIARPAIKIRSPDKIHPKQDDQRLYLAICRNDPNHERWVFARVKDWSKFDWNVAEAESCLAADMGVEP